MREALNDLQGKGGEVIVDQGFYDAGCTQSTIAGLSFTGPLLANQFVPDISAGQDTWYGLKATTYSLIAPPPPAGIPASSIPGGCHPSSAQAFGNLAVRVAIGARI